MMNTQTWMSYLSMLLIPIIFTGTVLMITFSDPNLPVSLVPINKERTQFELVLTQAGGHDDMPATPCHHYQATSDLDLRTFSEKLHGIPPMVRRVSETEDLYQLLTQ